VLYELEKEDYRNVEPLFVNEPLTYFQIVLNAIVAGNTSGRLWVDDVIAPNTMLMWDEGPILGLAGDESNGKCNKELDKLINRGIAPAAIARGNGGFKMFYSDGWEEVVGRLFKDLSLQTRDRVIFLLDKLKDEDWRDRIPDGCSVRQIDVELLRSDYLMNIERVKEEIACCWTSVGHFLNEGFGFCLITDDKIAAWCTAEYASGTNRGIGIETVEEYQGRGFATLTACAFVEYCMSNGLTPYWDAWKSNLASVAVAEKVGFRKVRDYSVFLGRFIGS